MARAAAVLLLTLAVAEAKRIDITAATSGRRRPAKGPDDGRVPKVSAVPTLGPAPPPGPIYDCESIPTYGLDSSFSCKWGQAWASCFSLDPRVKWHCASMKTGPTWTSEDICAKRKDTKGNWYDGRCLRPKHKDFAKAKKWTGGGLDLNRPWASKHARYRPKYLKSFPALPPVSEDAIGWNPTSKRAGLGCKFEVGVPAEGWIPGAGSCSPSLKINVLSYNLFWWQLFEQWQGAKGSAGRHIKATGPYDFMGFQECGQVDRVLGDAGLKREFATFSGNNAVAVAWRASEWTNETCGVQDVAEDGRTEHWGYREAVWCRLKHKSTGKAVFFINHHGPTPVRHSGGVCGPEATAFQLLKIIAQRAHKGDSVILIGDFNAKKPKKYDTQANTTTQTPLDRHLKLAYRGIDFGGVDAFYTNCAEVLETRNLNKGHIDTVKWHKGRMVYGGSDHDALSVSFKV